MKNNVTITDATRKWVGEFNAISSSLIERAFKNDIDNWMELTPIVPGNNVYCDGEYFKVLEVNDDQTKVVLECDDEEDTICLNDEIDSIEFIYVDNEKVDFVEYNPKNGVFVLHDSSEISVERINKIFYNSFEATVVNISKIEGDELDVDYEIDIELNKKVVDYDEVDLDHDSWLPMWGYLWTFDTRLDDDWTRDNLALVASCGFRIFEDQETGDIFLGIDGAGYDFYEAHWIPLYRARGLQWHDVDEDIAIAE